MTITRGHNSCTTLHLCVENFKSVREAATNLRSRDVTHGPTLTRSLCCAQN
jgi:hypothetical protein